MDVKIRATSITAAMSIRASRTVNPCLNSSPFGIRRAARIRIPTCTRILALDANILENTMELLLIGAMRNLPRTPSLRSNMRFTPENSAVKSPMIVRTPPRM
jgi:hypothetical protein